MYNQYMRVYVEARPCIAAQGKSDPKFAAFLRNCQAAPSCRNLDLSSYLIKPVQSNVSSLKLWALQTLEETPTSIVSNHTSLLIGVCKYPILLRELLKGTDPNHPDYDNIVGALSKVQVKVLNQPL